MSHALAIEFSFKLHKLDRFHPSALFFEGIPKNVTLIFEVRTVYIFVLVVVKTYKVWTVFFMIRKCFGPKYLSA